MRKNTLNFIVDLAALLAMLAIVSTGLLLYFILPPGSRGGAGLEFWGMDRHQWGDVHFWAAMVLLALVTLHVVLHWDWVCLTAYRWISPQALRDKKLTSGRQGLYGLALVVVLVAAVGGFLTIAAARVTRGAGDHEHGEGRGYRGGRGAALQPNGSQAVAVGEPEHGERRHEAGSQIRGSMTLAEVAELAGLSVARLKEELGLPNDIAPNEQLGRLRQRYGFQMSDVRRIVAERPGDADIPP